MSNEPFQIKVKSTADVKKLAHAICRAVEDNHPKRSIELRALGAGAVNQAVKAVAVASGAMVQKGISLAMVPFFDDFKLEDTDEDTRTLTCLRLKVSET